MAAQRTGPELIQARDDLVRAPTALRSEARLTVQALTDAMKERLEAPMGTLADYFAGQHPPGSRQMPFARPSSTVAARVTRLSSSAEWFYYQPEEAAKAVRPNPFSPLLLIVTLTKGHPRRPRNRMSEEV